MGWGSSFRRALNTLPAGRRTEREIRELSGLLRPLGMALRTRNGVSLHTQRSTGNPRPVGTSQPDYHGQMAQGWLPEFPTQQKGLCPGPGPGSGLGFFFGRWSGPSTWVLKQKARAAGRETDGQRKCVHCARPPVRGPGQRVERS